MTTTKIDYSGITCIPPHDDKIRFVLKKEGENPLFVIGLNTSTADENESDRTVGRAMRIAAAAKDFDGFVMFNLYPLREKYPSNLPETDEQKLVERNIAAIQEELGKISNPTILACLGRRHRKEKISLRKSAKNSLLTCHTRGDMATF